MIFNKIYLIFFLKKINKKSYEAWTLLAFMRMLIDLMGGRIRLLKTLEEQPPRKLFSVMPCCCLVFCDKPRHMTADLVGICRWGAIQAAIVRPFLAAINLFLQLNGGYRIFGSNTVYLVIDVLELISKMTSVFFIFVLYGSTSDVLKRYNIDRKFILLRVMFIPFIVQSFFISFIFTVIFLFLLFFQKKEKKNHESTFFFFFNHKFVK